MSNRCESCNKMVGLELQDPEVSDEEFDGDKVTAQVKITRNCADCGSEMKEATLDVEEEIKLEHKIDHAATPESEASYEVEAELSQLEEGGGRYKKAFFGAEGTFKVTCSCGAKGEVKWSDKVAASDMDAC